MSRVILADDYSLVVPEEVREESGLKTGEYYEVVTCDNGVFFIPLPPMDSLAGRLKLSDTNIDREGH